MLRRAVAIFAVGAAAFVTPVAVCSADPVVPQPGTACEATVADAMTWPADAKAPLECTGGAWQAVATPYPASDAWVSYGPPMKLHGEGLRNPVISSGAWTATPLKSGARCRAEQLAVVPDVGTGPPQVTEGEPGRVLPLEVVPLLFSIEMSGECLWRKVNG